MSRAWTKNKLIGLAVMAGLLAGASLASAADAKSASPHVKLDDFKIIGKRNIFDPNRTAEKPASGSTAKAPRVDAFSLVGTMSYEKGDLAFFDGTAKSYKKAVPVGGEIAGYKVTGITTNHVTLNKEEQDLEFPIGLQLRREDRGEWQMAPLETQFTAAYTPAPAGTIHLPGDDRRGSEEKSSKREALMEAVAAGDLSGLSDKQARKLERFSQEAAKLEKRDLKEMKDFKAEMQAEARGSRRESRRPGRD